MAYWKNSFDAAGTCASEVRNPRESYPRAMRISVMLIVAMYGLPALIGFSVIPDPSKWKSGSYMMIAKTIGGHFLEVSCPKFNLCFNKFITKDFVYELELCKLKWTMVKLDVCLIIWVSCGFWLTTNVWKVGWFYV
jgi:amino acid transporter